MKIKEVSKITGLTEKSIRLYEEKGLIDPQIQMISNRKFREYTEENVTELITIMSLRKSYFSIEQIKQMKEEPEKIPDIMKEYQKNLEAEIQMKQKIIETLSTYAESSNSLGSSESFETSVSNSATIEEIAQLLIPITKENPLPKADVKPNFFKLDRQNSEVNLLQHKRIYTRFSLVPKQISGVELLLINELWTKGELGINELVHACMIRGVSNVMTIEKTLRKMKQKGFQDTFVFEGIEPMGVGGSGGCVM